MATTFESTRAARGGDQVFIFKLALVMAAVTVAGFAMQFLMGRSTFSAPPRVHAHALVFMGWIALFLTQAHAAQRGNFALHRKLGRVAALWLALMLATGLTVTLGMVRGGTVPFFFYPQLFLISDPTVLLFFIGLTLYAVSKRHAPDWHMRLQICAFAAITGPGFGRLLPMPLLPPVAFEAAALCGLLFPLAGMLRDRKVHGAVHPAWWHGVLAIAAMVLTFDGLAYSPVGTALYHAVTAGTPAATVPGLALPPPPAM